MPQNYDPSLQERFASQLSITTELHDMWAVFFQKTLLDLMPGRDDIKVIVSTDPIYNDVSIAMRFNIKDRKYGQSIRIAPDVLRSSNSLTAMADSLARKFRHAVLETECGVLTKHEGRMCRPFDGFRCQCGKYRYEHWEAAVFPDYSPEWKLLEAA